MPDQGSWEGFFDPPRVLERLGLTRHAGAVADLGCGYGTFAIAAAQLTASTVQAFDIDPQMVQATAARARSLGLFNLRAIERDVVTEGTGLPDAAVGFAMLFNILHAEDAGALVGEAARLLSPRGTLAIVHWVHDAATPRGPPLSIRPRPGQCIDWARRAGLAVTDETLALPPYHYGVIARKPP